MAEGLGSSFLLPVEYRTRTMVPTVDGTVGSIFGLTEIDHDIDRGRVLTPVIDHEIDQGKVLTPEIDREIDQDKGSWKRSEIL